MVSEGFVGCTLGCLAGGAFEPNGAMLCLLSCYLVEIHGGDGGDNDNGNVSGENGGDTDGSDDGDGASDRDGIGDGTKTNGSDTELDCS
ncbi:MAG: hypothetical protein IH933_01595 [Euryarchaeota archaeon]|jgi:hypothetical protein|nr:hypothetical protein [Euryarchaeota archaeon]